jgi:glycyl-tRNA synthetase
MAITIDEMATFCKRKGFVYQNSEIYGGMTGFFDYGPLGVEVKNNLKSEWWKANVSQRDDVVGIDGTIITHPKVWVASGHVGCFADMMLTCEKCKEKIRADHFIEDSLKMAADGMKAAQINKLVKDNALKCPKCQAQFQETQDFNLMFKTFVGPKTDESSIAYLRPETAQLMFTNFRLVVDNARLKLPFGIAQMGRAFRNEISPRNFLFRCREFEQMEIEYFVHPDKTFECPYTETVKDHRILVYSADMQGDHSEAIEMSMKDALGKGIIKTSWHAYWLATAHRWFIGLGAKPGNFRIRQHVATEKSHYALDTWDLEYNFPFGWKELQGIANRTDYDLKAHMEHSGQDLSIFDEETKQKVIPHVVCEPSLGVDRSFLVFMFDAYSKRKDEKGNEVVVLKLHPKLASHKAGVFPLVNKLEGKAKEIYESLRTEIPSFYDRSGSIGRRYARADEIGIPYCITIDFQTEQDGTVTIRDRDTAEQKRVKAEELAQVLQRLVSGKAVFSDI